MKSRSLPFQPLNFTKTYSFSDWPAGRTDRRYTRFTTKTAGQTGPDLHTTSTSERRTRESTESGTEVT